MGFFLCVVLFRFQCFVAGGRHRRRCRRRRFHVPMVSRAIFSNGCYNDTKDER